MSLPWPKRKFVVYLGLFSFMFIILVKKLNNMGWFSRKSEKEKLQDQYAKLMAEAHKLSTSNRKLSDEKVAEAEEVMKKMDALA